MSSYLTTLAARALDQPQPIRPRLPSLLEPAPGPRVNFREISLNQPTRRAVKKASHANESPAKPERPATVSEPGSVRENQTVEKIAEEIENHSPAIKSFSETFEDTRSEVTRLDAPTAGLIERRPIDVRIEPEPEIVDARASLSPEPIKPTVHVAQAITIEQTNFVNRSVEASAQPDTAGARHEEPPAVSPQAIVVKPEVTANTADSVWVEPQLIAPEPQASVKITIGRIDVRAVMPQTPSTVTAPRPPAMKALSLDEYLQRRNGENR